MIYELRTDTLKPGSVPEFEDKFAQALAHRENYSKLGAFWHTIHGPLNQVIHVWPYEDLSHRERVRAEAAGDDSWPPDNMDLILNMESEILLPAPFMQPLGNRQLGNVYEMRIYTILPGSITRILESWAEALPNREKLSPLGACWYSDKGNLNKFFHVWAYPNLAERARIRAEAVANRYWPPSNLPDIVRMENKLLSPAAFSPMK